MYDSSEGRRDTTKVGLTDWFRLRECEEVEVEMRKYMEDGRTRMLTMLVAATLLAAPSAARTQGLQVDWSDYPRDPTFALDSVFQRHLLCWNTGQGDVCQLTVVTIGRRQCPVGLSAASWRTDTGELTISRTNTSVDLEFDDASLAGPMHWTLHLTLSRDVDPAV